MNPSIAQRWVQALRSGDFEQGRGKLNDGMGGFCCLGVLCEIAVADGVIACSFNKEGPVSYYDPDATALQKGLYGDGYTDMSETSLPKAVQRWAGLKLGEQATPNSPSFGGWNLIELNDTEKYSFDQIADVIEKALNEREVPE
jgi:hypothetical protein